MNHHPLHIPLNLSSPSTTTPTIMNLTHPPYPHNNKRSPPPFSLDLPQSKRHCSNPYTTNLQISDYEQSYFNNTFNNHTTTLFQHDIHHQLDIPTTPQDHSSSTHSNQSPPTTPSPINQTPLVEKLTKSRAVGQFHRDNEKEFIKDLERNIQNAKDENQLLFSLYANAYKTNRLHHNSQQNCNCLSSDFPEDHQIDNDQIATAVGLYKLSPETSTRLGIKYVSPAMAAILLEMIGYRRNWFNEDSCSTTTNNNNSETTSIRRKRRRTKHLSVPSPSAIENVVEYSAKLFANEVNHHHNIDHHMDYRFGNLTYTLCKWTNSEKQFGCPTDCETFGLDEYMFAPKSPTRPSAADFGSPPQRRRGEGVKTCSRCGVRKFSGSGHGRSTCADGQSISSTLPFPYIKGVDDVIVG